LVCHSPVRSKKLRSRRWRAVAESALQKHSLPRRGFKFVGFHDLLRVDAGDRDNQIASTLQPCVNNIGQESELARTGENAGMKFHHPASPPRDPEIAEEINSTKHQHPSSNEVPIIKLQIVRPRI
jgi:hypothetical protein